MGRTSTYTGVDAKQSSADGVRRAGCWDNRPLPSRNTLYGIRSRVCAGLPFGLDIAEQAPASLNVVQCIVGTTFAERLTPNRCPPVSEHEAVRGLETRRVGSSRPR